MAAALQDHLLALHSCIANGDVTANASKAHGIVGDIGHVCLQDVNDKDVEYCCSLLFNKETGVITFLKKVVQYDEYQNSKAEILAVLQSFATKWQKKILPYAVDLKDVCISTFTRERFSKVKNQSIPLLIEVVHITAGSKMSEEMQVTKMIEKFFMELSKASKHTATVKLHLFHLLGVLAEVYPEHMVVYAERLVETYTRTLKTEMTSKTKKPELPLITGCLQGLTHLLINFSHSAEEGSKHSYSIYKAMRMVLDKNLSVSRFDITKAGLNLLAKHAPQFNLYLIDDHQMMYETLIYWSNHHNREVRHDGMLALEAFLKQVCRTPFQGKKDGATFKFFIQQFRKIMDNPESNTKEVSIAVKGYGYFAAPCKEFLTPSDVKFMFNEMIQRSEQIYFSQYDSNDEKVISLPSFLEALASIVKELDEVSDTFTLSLERLVIIMMESYPKMNYKMHPIAYRAILQVLLAMAPKGAAFRGFISRVVYQGVIRACSHPVVLVTEEQPTDQITTSEIMDEEQQSKISYKDYVLLWNALLNPGSFKTLIQDGVTAEQRRLLTEALYDELITAILLILSRLDLSSNRTNELSQEEDEAGPSTSERPMTPLGSLNSDPVNGLQAARPKDFIIFINLVDFCKDLLPYQCVNQFEKWVFTFGHELILQSTRCPLVSGFYKMLSVCMKVCTKIAYFKDVGQSGYSYKMKIKVEDVKEEPMDVDGTSKIANLPQKEASLLLFTKFTKEVLVRMKQYKDDLLASCLSFVLSLPQEIVLAEMAAIVPAIQLSLRIGQSYLVLANTSLDALEYWSTTLPAQVIMPFYPQILPCLDAYLKTPEGDTEASTIALVSLKSSRGSRNKVPVKLLKSKEKAKSQETQLAIVKQRCIHLLGSLGGSVNHSLVTSTAGNIGKKAVAWDTNQHLKFDVPFMDIKPVIYFDPFLPRIVELATTSSDRQTKVAACELLHSMVLYMLGRGAMQPGGRNIKFPMEALYRRIFPTLLQLACDVEQVCRQLFEPMMMQLIRWFTSNKKFESEDTMALLDALMDGVVSPTDSALRDFSAVCIKEFLKWSIKQTSKKQMEKSPHNVKSLLKRLYSLARHPSAFRRLGSALAFNNIYVVFREEESLVDIFVFEILAYYVDSLALAHGDDKSLGTVEQCKQVLNHLERIIKTKASILTKKNKRRKAPKGWVGECDLEICCRVLLRQCGRPETECRHACMELVCKLCTLLDKAVTPKIFFETCLDKYKAKYFIERFETGMYKSRQTGGNSGLMKSPTIAKMSATFSLKAALSWFDLFLASLDCYTWVFGQGFLSPSQVLVVSGNEGTVIFQVMNYFITELAYENIYAAMRTFDNQEEGLIFTPKEMEDYNRAKCTVIVRIMNFLCILLHKHQKDTLKIIPGSLFCDELWEMVLGCVLEPTAIGFNMGDVDVMNNLPTETLQLLQVLNKDLPTNTMAKFQKVLRDKLSKDSPCDLFGMLPMQLEEKSGEHIRLCHLVSGLEQLHKTGLLVSVLGSKSVADKMAPKLLQSVFQSLCDKVDGNLRVARLSPTSHGLGRRILVLAFTMGLTPSTMLEHLLNKTQLKNAGTLASSDHGAIFYALFKDVLNSSLVAMAAKFVPDLMRHAGKEWSIVGSVLTGMLDQVSRDRILRKKEGARLVGVVLSHWHQIQPWWADGGTQETKTQTLTLLTKIIVVDSKMVCDVKQPYFREVFNMYLCLITDTKTPLGFKGRVLDLLVFFASLPEQQITELQGRLNRFVADNFPMKSSEFVVGSPKYNDYVSSVNKLLSAMELSGSSMLLELLISIMCREPRHVIEDDIQNAITRFVKRMSMDKHKLALDIPYKVFVREGSYPNDIRRAALCRVCLSILRLCHISALTEFFMDHIKEITTSIQAKPVKTSEAAMETQLVTKMCCFELIEVMYSRLPKDDVNTKNSKINNIYCSGSADTGKELTTAITKAAHGVKSEDMRGETHLLDLRRQLHCSAYNTLIAIISCTQIEIKFYNAFLFSDNIAKGQFLWDNLVDKKREYSFPIQMEVALERRKKFVSIRNEVRGEAAEEGDEGGEDRPRGVSVHYLASQYLADSSLSMDVTQFDFGASMSASTAFASSSSLSGSLGRVKRKGRRSVVKEFEEPAVTVKDDYVEMEMDELNQHECMASLTALLQHMMRNKITPDVPKGTAPSEMPPWMSNLHKKLSSGSTETNVKLFITKLLLNAQEVFKPYAKFWLGPIVQLIVTGGTGSPGLHYHVVDLIVTLLSWHTVAIPEDSVVGRAMASRLNQFVMENLHNTTRKVLRNNLDLFKTLIEVWKDRIDLNTKTIYDSFSRAASDPLKDNMTGVQMLGVLVANKMAPYTANSGVDKEKYFRLLAMNMNHTQSTMHGPTAEVVGMVLKYMSEKERSDDSKQWQESYMQNIAGMLMSLQLKSPDIFITCVYKMQLHHPPIVDKFVSKVLFMLPRTHGIYKTECLEIINSRVENIENLFLELKDKKINEILSHRDEETQQMALKLVRGMLRNLKPTELLYLLPSVGTFTSHSSATCRAIMYEIFMWTFDNYRNDEGDERDEIVRLSKDCLLHGLSDDDLHNRMLVQNFWSHETRLPTGTIDRMVAMLDAMYSPVTESHYLSYSTNLLLEMTSKSPDFNREIFEHPLEECRFEDLQVTSSWRQRHAAMTPLFVETQTSQSQMYGGDSYMDDSMSGQLRATQDVAAFTPTQQPGESNAPYNWLTQSSVDTYSDQNITLPATGESMSGLLFTIGKTPDKYKPVGPGFGKGRLKARDVTDGKDAAGSSQGSEIFRLKKRFLKDTEQSHIFFMKRANRLKKLKEKMEKERKQKRENQVTMYRKYRIGDLPDIQIKYSYIIAPLQALAQRDHGLARMLFTSVFKAIFAEIENEKTDRDAIETFTQINTCLNRMISTSTQYFPAFIACVLDIAREFPRKLELDPADVTTACTTSLQQPLGIELLEERLIRNSGEEERPKKKARGLAAPMSMETATWIELARLYKSLGDYDMLQGIFSSRIGTQELTMAAMEAETRGDYQTAARKYSEALAKGDWDTDGPQQTEVDLWEVGRLECYEKLASWEKLEQFTVHAIDEADPPNLDKVWDDTYHQENTLPFLIRGSVKLLMTVEEGQQRFAQMIDRALKVPERKALLENKYCGELSLMYLWQEDYDRARYYARQAKARFLQDWVGLDGLMTNSRASTLQSLQKLTELQEFLDFVGKEGNLTSSAPAEALVNRWHHRHPDDIMEPTTVWDDVITNRCVYIDHVMHKLEKSGIEGSTALEEMKVMLCLEQANACTEQDNFPVTLRIMNNTKLELRNLNDEKLDILWAHTYTRTQNKKCRVSNTAIDEKIQTLIGSVNNLDRYSNNKYLKGRYGYGRDHKMLRGEALSVLTAVLQDEVLTLSDLKEETSNKLSKVANSTHREHQEIVSSLLEKGYQDMKAGVAIAMEEEAASDPKHADLKGINNAHMTLVKYCDAALRQNEDDDGSELECASYGSFPVAIVNSLLVAMKNGSTEARQRFPRLLQLLELYPETMDTFMKKASEVPCWMFLGWIGQITALLDKPESPAIQDILLNLAKLYPQAVIYPFKMSADGYSFETTAAGKKAKQVKQKLEKILAANKLFNVFIGALEQFSQPNSLFKDWFDDVCKNMMKTPTQRNRQGLVEAYGEMYADLMDMNSPSEADLYDSLGTQSSVPGKNAMGKYRRAFAKAFSKQLQTAFGKEGKLMLDMSYKDFINKFQVLNMKMTDEVGKGTLKPPGNIKEYSFFLSDFEASKHDWELEIPGQYTGESKPLPEYHTKISSFDERVKVMGSLRKPKCITMRGNDHREYRFLVKGGEDLRQDLRIEQLFVIMNQVFEQDATCKQRHLRLRTYQVIPMTPRVGMIEWMDKTTTLKDFMAGAQTEKEARFLDSDRGPRADHHKFIGGSSSQKDNYAAMYKSKSRSDTVTAYRKREDMVPWDLLRRAYHNMSSSTEAFFTLRSNFAVSHALVSICQYILGIGDRHLSNFMIDLQNGCMVGIDFGHAFGSATQFLPVPELMPLRMTRQIRNVMMPLREKGLMEGTMIHALKALRNNSDLLMATMDVFIKEPSLDWQQNAEKQRKSMNRAGIKMDDDDGIDISWYPKQKVQFAKKKLQGYNSAHIMRDELYLGHSKSGSFKSMVEVIMGEKAKDIRAKLPQKDLSVEQQVACLLNHATDPNILGRFYIGWEPWM